MTSKPWFHSADLFKGFLCETYSKSTRPIVQDYQLFLKLNAVVL